MKIDQLQTPCYVIDEKKMRENLEILKKVQEDTGCKILLAQKELCPVSHDRKISGRYHCQRSV